MILVVAANTNTCRIYQYLLHPAQLILEKEISHPESKLRNSAISADRSGAYQPSNGRGSAYSPRNEPKDVEIEQFTREIAKELNQQRSSHPFEKMILIASAQMTGLLNQHFDKYIKERIIHSFKKDLLHLKDHELLHFLAKNMPYPK